MEVLLNCLWIALATAAFAAFPRARRSRAAALALLCAVALLFPIVSMTDDLAQQVAAVESTRTRAGQLPALWFGVAAVSLIVPLALAGFVAVTTTSVRNSFLSAPSDPRSPPAA